MNHIVDNDTPVGLRLVLEPWANEFNIPPGSKFAIAINASALGVIETVLTSEFHIVWLWGGCTARVSLDGADVTPSVLSIPAFG